MSKKLLPLIFLVALSLARPSAVAPREKTERTHGAKEEITRAEKVELWRAPRDLRRRNLFYGEGGAEHAPHSTFTFTKEDMHGTNPKLHVRDENGVKWRIKLGVEAGPETAASRLLWAAGYSTNEFYFLREIRVEGLPAHLHRGQNLVGPDGIMRNVELRRDDKNQKKLGIWRWHDNPFVGTRQLNGLRVMMALLNNWDLKDDNNGIYEIKKAGSREEVYRVSDLGASFGRTGPSWTPSMAKGNLHAYEHSRFIHKVTPEDVDFYVPTRPALKYLFDPPGLIHHLRLSWIGRHIPRADARWVGQLLSQLSPEQIQDAFRAGGYSPNDAEAYARVVENRIRELEKL